VEYTTSLKPAQGVWTKDARQGLEGFPHRRTGTVWYQHTSPRSCGTARDVCENESHEIETQATEGEAGGRKGVNVNDQSETPFDSIEGSHEYVAMLAEAVDEARREVEADIAAAEREGADRRKKALLLISYNLAKLNLHITTSRRILNDLRSLRRLLLSERGTTAEEERTMAAGE